MTEAENKSSATLEAKVIRKDGTVENLGEIWNNNKGKDEIIETIKEE